MKTSRRHFIQKTMGIAGITSMGIPLFSNSVKAFANNSNLEQAAFQFRQDPLPYAYSDLEPYIDAKTMEIHYTKHHATYVKNVNEAIASEKIQCNSEKDFFSKTATLSDKARNNGGGSWNHNFFWKTMSPKKDFPNGKVSEALNSSFGSFDKFKEAFTKASLDRFGSGWIWLVHDNGKLKIGSTPNQDNPLMSTSEFKGTPILALDVWEHAYYLKYQNKRNEYIENWWNIVNWNEAAKNLV